MTPYAIESVVATYERIGAPPELLNLAPNVRTDGPFLRGLLAGASSERQREIATAINLRADQLAAEREEAERRHVRGVLAGTEERTPAEEAERQQLLIEAEAERQAYVARRPERIEDYLARICRALEAK